MDILTGIIGGLFFVLLIIFAHLALLFLVQGALVAVIMGVGCTFSSYVRENRGRVMEMLNAAIKYRLYAIPGVIVFDLLAYMLLADSFLATTWIEDDWVGWLGLGLCLMVIVGLAFLISFWGKTKKFAETHNRVLFMEAIVSVYFCWIGAKLLIGD